jgi:hypothetical protein
LAHAHGYKVERLCRLLLGVRAGMWNRDVDRSASQELADAVKSVTAASDRQFLGATLNALEGMLSEQVVMEGNSRWIIPLSIYHRTRRKPGLMCCGPCLASDAEPYFRRSWRIAAITVCTKHRTNLIETCPNCYAPLMPHRTDVGHKAYAPTDRLLVLCHACGFDLRHSEGVPAQPEVVNLTVQIERTVSAGYIAFGTNPSLHSVAFLNGVRILIRAARRIANRKGSSESISSFEQASKIGQAEFEALPLTQRRVLMTELAEMLASGPNGIAPFLRQHRVIYSQVCTCQDETPYWLLQALLPLKRSQHPERSPEETQAIADAVERRAGFYSPEAAREMFSAHLAPRMLPQSHRAVVSDDAYELLMASIDHDIGDTFDKKLRFALLQDKVMYGLLRCTKVTTAELATAIVDCVTFIPDEEPNFETEPRTEKQALLRLAWHVKRERSRLSWTTGHSNVFLSPYTLRPIGSTAIQDRFKKAVNRACLNSSIAGIAEFKINFANPRRVATAVVDSPTPARDGK